MKDETARILFNPLTKLAKLTSLKLTLCKRLIKQNGLKYLSNGIEKIS